MVAAVPAGTAVRGGTGLAVVDDVVGAEGADQVGLGGAADPGDLGPEGLGELDGVAADAAGGADDQDFLPGLA
jgi:hypothetical protein